MPPTALAALPQNDFADDSIVMSLRYVDLDLSARRAESVEISHCHFDGVRFAGSRLTKAMFGDTVLDRCDLANVTIADGSMVSSSIKASRLTGMSWGGGHLRDVVIDDCRADMAVFRFARLKNVHFRRCNLRAADFQSADLRGSRFDDCDLSEAQFSNAQLSGARLKNCTLLGIRGVTSMRGAIIRSDDALGLAYSLAGALGITIED